MKHKVFMPGVVGHIGRELKEQLKHNYEIVTLSSRDLPPTEHITYLKRDIFSLREMEKALEGIHTVIFFEDPIMRNARKIQGKFEDLYLLISDNIARAAEYNNVCQIIYVTENVPYDAVVQCLESYSTPVQKTSVKVSRRPKMLNMKVDSKNSMRSVHKFIMPENMDIEDIAMHYFSWLNESGHQFINVEKTENDVEISLKANNETLLHLSYVDRRSKEGIVRYDIVGGKLENKQSEKRGRMEFRALRSEDAFLIALHYYEPSLPWHLYLLTQANFHQLVQLVYSVEMRIVNFETSGHSV